MFDVGFELEHNLFNISPFVPPFGRKVSANFFELVFDCDSSLILWRHKRSEVTYKLLYGISFSFRHFPPRMVLLGYQSSRAPREVKS